MDGAPADNGPATWAMQAAESPLFDEYLELCHKANWGERLCIQDTIIGPGDALIVVDMQNDFVPKNEHNSCGAFAVAEGDHVADGIVKLMNLFGDKGGYVVCTRDYHPDDHCSFLGRGGPFPPHCLQGSRGSMFYPPIGNALAGLLKKKQPAEVVFKGYHEAIDSFGSLQYPDNDASKARLAHMDASLAQLHNCSMMAWTGAVCLKCTNLPNDVNAPPDVLSVLRRSTLAEKMAEREIKRVFVCGLALDYCVLDTARNSVKAGFAETYVLLDASRAAHIPGIGEVGTGFLQDPKDLYTMMKSDDVRLMPSGCLLGSGMRMSNLPKSRTMQPFPSGLGPFSLVPAADLVLTMNFDTLTYTVTQPQNLVQMATAFGLAPSGKHAEAQPVTLSADKRAAAGIPEKAVKFCWVNPMDKVDTIPVTAMSYLPTTSEAAAFLIHGGFVYLDEAGSVCHVGVLQHGPGFDFGPPEPFNADFLAAVKSRMHPVTLPALKRGGAKYFAWIHAGEELAVGGNTWRPSEHGAFVYLFGSPDTADSRDIFFPVV
jgi:nicotinamidase-related amidase